MNGEIRIKTLIKFLNLCTLTMQECRALTLTEITDEIHCSKGHAYNYLRALKYLYPKEMLDKVREQRENRFRQQVLA